MADLTVYRDRAVAIGRAVAAAAQAEITKGWRDSDAGTLHAQYDLRIVDYWAPRVQRAMAASYRRDALNAAILTALQVVPRRPLVVKSAIGDDPLRALIASVGKGSLWMSQPDQQPLLDVLRGLYADSWVTGGHVAAVQTGGKAGGAVGTLIAGTDWGTWQPGDVHAAIKVADGAFARLLDNADVTIRGLNNTTINRLGNRIADGLLDGQSVDGLARDLGPILDDPYRAMVIAHTEMARAMTEATADTYALNGIRQFDWLTTSGACPLCLNYEGANPHDLTDVKPPGHPLCRCAMAPHVATFTTPT